MNGDRSFDFVESFHEAQHTRETIVREIDAMLAAHGVTAGALPFYSETDPAAWLPSVARSSFRLSLANRSEGLLSFQCTLRRESDTGAAQVQEGRFFVYEHPGYPNVHVLLMLEPPYCFERLKDLVSRAFPKAITTFITHRTLRRLLEEFSAQHELSRLIIRRASFRIRFQEGDHDQRPRIWSGVGWPDMELREAFDWVYQQNGWFQSLQFDACRDHQVLAKIGFTRQGATRTSRLFAQVFAGFVEPVCKTIDENVRFFGQRSRRAREDLSVRPLVIQLEPEQIAESEERRRFIEAMRRFRSASVSVLHGNPYVHLSVLDYYDGSAFDVWVLSGNEITIVPQMKGSVPAIKRLIHHVFDSYAEGRIREYQGGKDELR